MSSVRPVQALGLSSPQITPWQQVKVESGDSLSRVFHRVGLEPTSWMALLKLKAASQSLRDLRPGDSLDIRKTPTGELAELRYDIDDLNTLVVHRKGGQLVANIDKKPTQTREVTASGTVGRTLSSSLAARGVPANVAAQMAHIFAYRHNMSRSMHRGDRFSVVYRAVYSGTKEISTGPVIAVSITTNHQNYKAFLAKNTSGQPDYYDTSGHTLKPSFTRRPVAYTRISSPFSLHRLDPVTHVVRAHKGVDMAAPAGTPIHAAASGTIKYAGWMHGYGRLVEMNNFDGYSTRYAHMHGIAHGLHVGEHVQKGDVIGYVGQSGEATGPHLHFEIRKDGIARNPLTVKLPGGEPMPHSEMVAFTRRIQPLIAKLDPPPATLVAKTSIKPRSNNSCTSGTSLRATLALDPVGAARRHPVSNIFCVVHRPPTSA